MGGRESVSPLVGTPAPNVASKMLDGSPFNLQDRYAENILMVDFWATWCGPCVVELPILMRIAEHYADRGVTLYGINQGEDVETIQNFLDEQKWNLNVVLDQDGAAGNAFAVEGIPQLVIIDKEGTVQSVHIGYRPNIEDVLREELDALLEGKGLAQ
jgi:thiol-disulfide isomerase/thioredoxin